MSLTAFSSDKNVFIKVGHIHGRAFLITAIQDTCAHLSSICSGLAYIQVKCAHFSRFECLLPHVRLAC